LITNVGFWEENYLKLARTPDSDFFARVISSGAKIEPLKELTVIKFPSSSWKSYKNKEQLTDIIQLYSKRITANAKILKTDLLNEIAFEYSRYHLQGMILPMRIIFKMIKRKLTIFLEGNLKGMRLFNYIFFKRSYYKYHALRKKGLKKRGLD